MLDAALTMDCVPTLPQDLHDILASVSRRHERRFRSVTPAVDHALMVDELRPICVRAKLLGLRAEALIILLKTEGEHYPALFSDVENNGGNGTVLSLIISEMITEFYRVIPLVA